MLILIFLIKISLSFYSNFLMLFLLKIIILFRLILTILGIEILNNHRSIIKILKYCLLIEINTFFLRINNFRGLIQIKIHLVFIDRVHFKTTFIKCYILRTVVNCIFFFYLKHLVLRWSLHY